MAINRPRRLCMVRCRWRGISPGPARDQTAIRLDGGIRLNAATPANARGMQRESASVSLAKMVLYYNTHLAEQVKSIFGSAANSMRRFMTHWAAPCLPFQTQTLRRLP